MSLVSVKSFIQCIRSLRLCALILSLRSYENISRDKFLCKTCRITERCVFDRVDDCVLSVAFCHRSGWAKGCQKGESGAVRVGWSSCKKVQFGLVTLIWFLRYCTKDDPKSHQLHLFDDKTRVQELSAVRVGWSSCKKLQFGLIWFFRYCVKDHSKSGFG